MTVVFAGIAALSTTIYAIVAGGQLLVMRGQLGEIVRQYPELKKSAEAAKEAADVTEQSFKLTKRHTEDSDEAIAQARGEPEAGTNIERITISNIGKMSAHKLTAHIEISRNILPSNKRISLLGTLDISQDELRIDTPITKTVVMPDIGKTDWNRIQNIEESIVVSAAIQYENGFDDMRWLNYCQEFLAQLPHPGDSPQAPMHVLVDCDGLPAYFQHEKLIQSQAHH